MKSEHIPTIHIPRNKQPQSSFQKVSSRDR